MTADTPEPNETYWDKESIYDQHISPLMAQIIALCKEHEIPMVAQFQYAHSEDKGGMYCTTTLPFPNASEHIRNMVRAMKPPGPFCLAETYITNPDGSKVIKIQRIS